MRAMRAEGFEAGGHSQAGRVGGAGTGKDDCGGSHAASHN
jgi:hypothetical protein